MAVIGWKIDKADRARLLTRFPPLWPDIVADHVTLKAGAGERDPLPPHASAQIVGSVSDGTGLQALVVAIGGRTDRPGGGAYHITWSLDRARGRRAVESNDVIARLGWDRLDQPVSVRIVPARF